MESSLVKVLREEQKKNVVIYGAGIRRAGVTQAELREFHVRVIDLEEGDGSLGDADAIILMKQLIARRDIFEKLLDYCRAYHADIYDMQGKKINRICEEARKRKVSNKEELAEQIAVHDCISFDVFDTLLIRKAMLPEDVFELVGRKLREDGIIIKDFKKKRLKAQEELGLNNPTIDDIYDRFCKKYKLSQQIGKRCRELELEVESRVLIPRQEMVQIYQECLNAGKKVSLVTDMYIPEKLLAPLLEKNGISGYSALYVSCDRKQLKLQGLLKTYRDEVGGSSYLHIGDHVIHDGICAALTDMDYCLVAVGYKLAQTTVYGSCMEQAHSLEARIMLGMVLARVFNSPFAMPDQEGKLYFQTDYDYGYAFFAPLISQFAIWLYRQITDNQFDDVLFAARDGFLMKKLYGILRESMEDETSPEGIYFYTSRKAAVLAGIDNDAYINMLIDISRHMPPRKMMRERFGLDAKDILLYDEEKYGDSIHKYVWDHANAIFARSDLAKKNYFKYMGNLQLKIGARYAFMDFVSSGTSQKSLGKIVPFALYGLYAGWNGAESKESVGVRAFVDDKDSFFMGHYKIMETFMTSCEPSVSHFDGKGEPVFSAQDRSRKELEYVVSMQKACEDYLRELLELVAPTETTVDSRFADRLFSICDYAVVLDADSVLNHLSLMDNWCKRRNKISQLIQ